MRRLIGITGRAQHGKDTTASVLVEEFSFTRFAFADTLKSMALTLNPNVEAYGYLPLATLVERTGWDEAKKNLEVRRFLQVLGTEAVRDHLGQDAWVDALRRKIVQHDGDVVISDVRFPNEANMVRAYGGELWRVVRLDVDDYEFDNGLGTDHPSERHVASLAIDRELRAVTKDDLVRAVRDTVGHFAGATRA